MIAIRRQDAKNWPCPWICTDGRSKVWIAYREGEPGILCVASEESKLNVKPEVPRRDPRYLFNGELSLAAMVAVARRLK